MKRLNNKGYMLVEVIVASSIALVIAYFLIDITIKLVNKNNDYYLESILLSDKNLVTKEIMDDINSMKLTGVVCPENEYYCDLTFNNDDSTKKTLTVNNSNKTITYGDYSKTFSDEVNLSQINIKAESNILTISVDAYTNYSKENYGVKIVVPYNEDISIILPPEYSILVDDLEKFKTTTEVEYEDEFKLEYVGPVTETITLSAGKYKLETWGAQGGKAHFGLTYKNDEPTPVPGGKGGYSYGTLNLNNETTIYVYAGGSGQGSEEDDSDCETESCDGFAVGGFNGGGTGSSHYSGGESLAYFGGAGGGASDIRIGTDSLYARVIVAGGGGGGGTRDVDNMYSGGAGGGTSGIDGKGYDDDNLLPKSYGSGAGTQTSVGDSYYYYVGDDTVLPGGSVIFGDQEWVTNSSDFGILPEFGSGGGAEITGFYYKLSGIAGGGGGWYGGGYAHMASAGGGSGYIYTSSTASDYPTGCLLDSSYYLTDAATIAGNQSFTDFDGTTVTGHEGNGAIRISGTQFKTKTVTIYSVPQLSGLTDITINKGTDFDLMSGVTIECETSKTGCSITGTSPSSTKNLPTGTAKIYYMVLASDGVTKYRYPRNITVVENE